MNDILQYCPIGAKVAAVVIIAAFCAYACDFAGKGCAMKTKQHEKTIKNTNRKAERKEVRRLRRFAFKLRSDDAYPTQLRRTYVRNAWIERLRAAEKELGR